MRPLTYQYPFAERSSLVKNARMPIAPGRSFCPMRGAESDLQSGFALRPVAGAQLVGLQSVEHAQHLLRIATHGKIRHVDEADHVVRVDEEGGALRHAGVDVEDAQLPG